MSENGIVEGVTQASPAGLVGKDELGMTAVLGDFKPVPTERLAVQLREMLSFTSDSKVESTFVRLDADCYVTCVRSAIANAVFALYVEEGDEKTFFSQREGKEITFRPKTVRYYRFLGEGDSGLDEASAFTSELREAIELVAMRALGGFGRAEHDGADDFDLEDEIDEIRALME